MNVKKLLAALLAALLLTAGAGCQSSAPASQSSEAPPPQIAESSDSPRAESESATYLFIDSCGREVELPKNVERIAPSGPLAQIVLFTLCPDKMVGFANDISDKQFGYIGEKYASLPVFGNFYGDTLNLESVMTAAPQIIFDIGEAKDTIKDDMTNIQEKTGIPTVFVEMDLETMVSAYTTLGEITGDTEQAQLLIDYIQKTLSDTQEKVNSIPEADRVSVYYGQDDGLAAVVKGTVHADVIDIVGGLNVADIEQTIRGGTGEISMEQLMLWNPDVVLFAPESIYDSVASRAEWQEINAIKNGRYYEIPDGPYNWMGRPPSVNRLLGIKWLSNLLYPDLFAYDMVQETQEFYKLFYHCDVTEEQVQALLGNSTLKQ